MGSTYEGNSSGAFGTALEMDGDVRWVYDPITRRVRPQGPDGRWLDEDQAEESVIITPEDTKVFASPCGDQI